MKLRTKYLVFVILLHLVTLVLSYFVFEDRLILFIAAEVLVIISLFIAYRLYKELIQPLQTLMSGVEAIRDRDFNVKFVKTGKYEMDQLIDVYNSMIDQLRNERTQQEQQHYFLEKLIRTSPTGIVILDHDDNLQQLNPRACAILGVDEQQVRGKPVAALSSPVMQELGSLRPGEAKTVSVNGIHTFKLQKSHFIDRGFSRSFVMIEELTAEILAAEKKAYGKVIRMMAHEVNNTIGPVNSILESTLGAESIWRDDKLRNLQQALQVAVDRNHNLNLFMRNFADVVRLPEPVMRQIDLHALVRNVATLMQLQATDKGITFSYDLSPEPLFITGDQQQIEQALINIVKNSIEAIDGKGTITFSTTTSPVTLAITDTGKGIAREDAEQLFSPFFSTKKDGQGVGLTLVKEILLNHGFEFSLQTVELGRTVFEVRAVVR